TSMKKSIKVIVTAFLLVAVSMNISAQDNEEITNDQLYRYALMQKVIDAMKKDISVEVNIMIKAQEGMTGKRYKELAATKGDEAKLQAVEAKDWEIQFLNQVDGFKNKRIESIKTVNTDLATKMVGDKGRVYKRIKAELQADVDLKSRYTSIVSDLNLDNSSD
ncbi:MAG: hypothetical protein O6939_02975, partial [Bacteroidetes bacterium]|nr:hypothetical protein [Bacteroidota bacterium]